MPWTWDVRKNAANRQKHGVSFEVALLVFEDPFGIEQRDPHSAEERWRAVGVIGASLYFVVHTRRIDEVEAGATGRIISARKANRKERWMYEKATG